ncbi:uncharacterized protein BDR25DRAFT_332296 [Lindgomyces ingoldianus]|uniref:Uncharacterized protein n=1 Tax=Lindgomyces ingoldianus TaxID=673940 RepID=A0ACB6R4W1_9PLEO|nr:uncharacterized protein BDR25DRAFT_332296 [Lindgomyces ingoldianus]KAF2474107.1 hypothetical protein BDR25DRAFT_332296 [Lindgomyces ingoldianus]
MSGEADDNVLTLQSFIEGQLSYDDCVKLLRVCNNDLQQALNKFYDQGPSALQESFQEEKAWDSSAFHADRYGQNDGPNVPTFNIDYARGIDNYPHSGAPSRPPSRTSHRSGASGAHAGDVPVQSVETGPQESGVIGDSGAHFGPANRPSYDDSQWALVPLTTSAEFVPDAVPSQRKREEDGPVILKPIPSGDYLPALITILHSIPLFRNALLAPAVFLKDYTIEGEWWKGDTPEPARTVEYGSGDDSASELDMLHEVQRLMAFLDSSDRAYGSVGRLQQLDAFKRAKESTDQSGEPEALAFLMAWGNAYQGHTPHAALNSVLRNVFKAEGQNQESWMLDATVIHHDPTTELTLYDVLDQTLFVTSSGNAHIVDISNVLVLRLTASNTNSAGLNCKFPATFYADRYLEKNRAQIDAMFGEMKQYEDKIAEMDEKASRLKYQQDKTTGKPVDALKLLKTSIIAFEPKEDDSAFENTKNKTILSQLQSIYESVERKINALEEEKKKVRETLDRISSRFKGPMDNGTESAMVATEPSSTINGFSSHALTSPFKLYGVSTRPGVYYLLHPDIKSDIPDAKQWWRIEYSTATSEAYVLRERLTLANVLEKASSEHSSALLVYANEEATRVKPADVPEQLQKFVKQDNLNFLEELTDDLEGKSGVQQIGDWDKNLSTYADDGFAHYGGTSNMSAFGNQFESINTAQFHSQNQESGRKDGGDEEMSSTTLTPNTEVGDDGAGEEMREVNGGMGAWVGNYSNASSETVGRDTMDVPVSQQPQTVHMRDVEMGNVRSSQMMDVDLRGPDDRESSVRHIEVLEERKGG